MTNEEMTIEEFIKTYCVNCPDFIPCTSCPHAEKHGFKFVKGGVDHQWGHLEKIRDCDKQ